MPGELTFYAVERHEDMPRTLDAWLASHDSDPLAPTWVVVPSAALRQRLEWDMADIRDGDRAISSHMRYFFPEEFVRTVEESVLDDVHDARHEWRPETIATRLVGLSRGELSWTQALSEAATLDEMVRWRRDLFDPTDLPAASRALVNSSEWVEHGPFVQRDRVLAGLAEGRGNIAPLIVLYGLDNAPGGRDFIALVQAVAAHHDIVVITPYPAPSRLASRETVTGISWWRSLDEHVALWRDMNVNVTPLPGASRPGILGRLQNSLGAQPAVVLSPEELNVQVLGAVGPARQVEMARDEILRLLDENPTLEPHHILVTSAQLGKFSPHLERHWAHPPFLETSEGETLRMPRLAFELTERDGSALRTRALLLSHLLDAVGNYVAVEQVEELLQFTSLCENVGLTSEAVSRLSVVAREGRVTFGTSPEQRREVSLYAPDAAAGTWQRFFDRLAFTAMTPDVDDPDQLGTSGDLSLVAGVRQILGRIEMAQESLGTLSRRSIPGWVQWCTASFGVLTERAGSRDDSLERAFSQITSDSQWLDPDLEVPFSFFRDYWNSLVSSRTRGQTFGRFGVHVAPLTALASSAYDFVVILGLDEENFPNASLTSPTFQPPRLGDPNPRNALLGSLLLAVTAARRGLVVTYNSRSELSGEPVPSPVVIAELLEYLGTDAVVSEGPRHGFLRPLDRPVTHRSYDPRYRGLGALVAGADRAPSLISARLALMAQSVSEPGLLTQVSVKELQYFLNDAVGHFITRGLLGATLPRLSDENLPPRLSYNALERYAIRSEIIEAVAAAHSGPDAVDAASLHLAILRRESVAADIPLALVEDLISTEKLERVAASLVKDLASFDATPDPLAAQIYADVTLPTGVIVSPRTGQRDESRPWTVYRDMSSRASGDGGGPTTYRFYPNVWDKTREWRSTLAMWVDLLVMKVTHPRSDDYQPVANEFFALDGARGENTLIALRYTGTRDEALASLSSLVQLYDAGRRQPLALGRYSTAMEVGGADGYAGFVKDRAEPTFAMTFGEDYGVFVNLAQSQGVTDWCREVASRVERCRETATKRSLGRLDQAGERAQFVPFTTVVESEAL